MGEPRQPGRRSAAATFVSGTSRGRAAPRSGVRRRVLLLLIPGLVCVALAIGGVALVDQWDPGAGEESAAPASSCDPASAVPEIDLGIRPGGGTRLLDGSRVTYEPLDRADVRRLVTRAKRAGAATISTRALWVDLQRRSGASYDWRPLDLVVDEAGAQDLQVRLRTGSVPAFALDRASRRAASGDTARWRPPLTAGELRRWSDFLGDLTRHVRGRVDYIEVWEEPNTRRYWRSGPDPEAFARLLAVSYGTIKRLDPSVTVISGGLRHNDIGFLEAVYDAREQRSGAGEGLFDQVGVHPYSGDRGPDETSTRWIRGGPFGAVDMNFTGFLAMRRVMRDNGDEAVPLYLSEFGYSTRPVGEVHGVPDETRARYLRQAYETVDCAGGVRALAWSALHPGPGAGPARALLDREGNETRTYRALRGYAREAGVAG